MVPTHLGDDIQAGGTAGLECRLITSEMSRLNCTQGPSASPSPLQERNRAEPRDHSPSSGDELVMEAVHRTIAQQTFKPRGGPAGPGRPYQRNETTGQHAQRLSMGTF